jgi:outer membrane protein OmpA-like peptidoglycan-associated protein
MHRISKGFTLVAVLALCLALYGCTAGGQPTRTAKGAAIGTAAGAAIGAAIGSTQGEVGKGAVIGGLAGAALGTAVGYNLERQAKALEQIPEAKVERRPDSVIVTLNNSILFATNSASLLPASQESLNQIADVMIQYPENQIIVKGHTDSTGAEDYNQQLSERRALMVKNYIVGRGVASHRVVSMGFGESVPIADNSTESGRAQNRRVEIEIRPN